MKRFLSFSVLLAALVLLTISPASAQSQDSEIERNTLRGIATMGVVIESLDDQARQDGLREQDIQTDVEQKLRLAGIKVVPVSETYAIPGSPYLYVDAQLALNKKLPFYAYDIDVTLEQRVFLDRDHSVFTHSTTWSTGSFGSIGKSELPEIRNSIKEQVDKFLKAYLAVNPKKPF